MRKLREILQHEYIGAIMIGFILAQCVSTVVNVLVQAGAFYWQTLHAGGTFDQRPAFPWNSFTISLVSALLYLVPAYLLIRWLYYPPSVESEADGGQGNEPLAARGE
jgi:hypothetical protein